MAEGRFVSRSIATDWELNRVVSFEADYLFRACIPFIDREGRMTGHPGEVKAKVCPLRENMTPEVVDRCLWELAEAGLVLWYEVDGRPALWFKGFSTHQKGLRADREAASKLPSQQSPNLKRLTTLLRSDAELVQSTPAEVKVSEVKLREEQITATQRVAFVEKSYSDAPDYSRFDLLEHAHRECGLGKWGRADLNTASSVIVSWMGEGKGSGEIFDAIHGARLLVDAGKVNWKDARGSLMLRPRHPFGLQALRNTFTLGPQGDGEAQRPFFDVAREEYIRRSAGAPLPRTANTGPERIGKFLNLPDDPRQAGSSA